MKIYRIKFCIQPLLQFNKVLSIFLLLCILIACAPQQSPPVSGIVVPWEDVDDLIDRSESQADLRKSQLEVQIKLSKHQYRAKETISVKVYLHNKSSQDIIVREPNSMPALGNDATTVQGIIFLITDIDSGEMLEREESLLPGFVQEGFPPPEAFSVLPGQKSFVAKFYLSDIFELSIEGRYSIQLVYTNYDFGAEIHTGSSAQFIDYNAWIGTIVSNTEEFQITP